METRKITAIAFAIIGLTYSVIFASQTDFSITLQSYFSMDYLMSLAPIMISLTLFLGGIFLFKNLPKAKFILALFGHTVLEILVFDWFEILTVPLSNDVSLVFFVTSIAALGIAYSNTFELRRLSLKEGLMGILMATAIDLLPHYI